MSRPFAELGSRKSKHHRPYKSRQPRRIRSADKTPADLPCLHRGEQIDTRPCNTCGGNKGKPQAVYACAVHGECTMHQRIKRDHTNKPIHACVGCDDQQPTATVPPQVVGISSTLPRGRRTRYECDVLIPYYRKLKWLPATVEAIASQMDVITHIHLINDQSPEDDTVARRELSHLPRLYWYRNRENIGPYRSYHNVWDRLQTTTVAIQDADDFPLPHRLWRACQALDEHQADIYGAAMEQSLDVTAAGDDPVRNYVQKQPILASGPKSKMYPYGILINGTMAARREAVERINGFADSHCGADTEFVTRAHAAGLRVVHDSAVVAVRRVHPTSLSRGGPHGVGSDSRKQRVEEWLQRYQRFATAGPNFDFRQFGSLDRAQPQETILEHVQ